MQVGQWARAHAHVPKGWQCAQLVFERQGGPVLCLAVDFFKGRAGWSGAGSGRCTCVCACVYYRVLFALPVLGCMWAQRFVQVSGF